jgi:N-acetylneuraminic acid mutarotase
MLPTKSGATAEQRTRPRVIVATLALGLSLLCAARADAACVPSATSACLQGARFRVEVDWHDFVGNGGAAQVAASGTPDSGLFWFYGPDNWEVLVKVLNGCQQNDRYWVFAAAATTLQYTMTVTDTATGAVRTYSNPLGAPSPSTTDTEAFATCAPGDTQAAGSWTPCSFTLFPSDTVDCALAPMSLGARSIHGSAALGGELFVVGGARLFGPPRFGAYMLSSVEAYDPTTDHWRSDIAPLPRSVVKPNVAAVGGRLYVLGFMDDLRRSTANGRVFVYDPVSDVWTEGAPMPLGTERGDSGTAVLDGLIYVAGGWRDGSVVADFAAYDPIRDSWSTLPSMPTPRGSLAAGAADGKVVFLGGKTSLEDQRGTRVVEEYSPSTATWTSGTAIPPVIGAPLTGGGSRAIGVMAATLGDKIYVLGGDRLEEPNFWLVFFTNQSYTPATGLWADETPLQTARRDAALAALGNKIYVTGGDSFRSDDTLAAYRPLGD